MNIRTKAKCAECDRIFDLLDEDDACEWYYGHDCEPGSGLDEPKDIFEIWDREDNE